jgi:hypothetical protein
VDAATHKPLAGAKITLHCMGRAGIEGPNEIRRVTRTSNTAGEFNFSAADLAGCSEVLLGGEMDGYHAVGAKDDAHVLRDVSGTIAFVTNAQTLPELGPSTLDLKIAGSADPLTAYNIWFSSFMQAKKIATTPDQVAGVQGKFCDPLRGVYEKMNDREKMTIGKLSSSHRDEHGQWVNVYSTTYERDVQPYCNGL